MPSLVWPTCIGQDLVKGVLSSAFNGNTLGHAYLFSGDAGCGAVAAAIDLGMALLCTDPIARPCGSCASCKKIRSGNHPDFRFLFPLALSAEHKKTDSLTDEGNAYVAQCAIHRILNPYDQVTHESIPSIPIDWIREANHAVMRGALDGERSITIIDEIDVMNKESSNAMLKILEEPPAGTLFILISSRAHALLPTITSRCQHLRFGHLSPELIRNGCAKLASATTPGNIDLAVQASLGSLGRALTYLKNPDPRATTLACELLAHITASNWLDAAKLVDEIDAIGDHTLTTQLFMQIMQIARNALLNASGANYFSSSLSVPSILERLTPSHAGRLERLCQGALSDLAARGNSALVLVNFLFGITETLNVQK